MASITANGFCAVRRYPDTPGLSVDSLFRTGEILPDLVHVETAGISLAIMLMEFLEQDSLKGILQGLNFDAIDDVCAKA